MIFSSKNYKIKITRFTDHGNMHRFSEQELYVVYRAM